MRPSLALLMVLVSTSASALPTSNQIALAAPNQLELTLDANPGPRPALAPDPRCAAGRYYTASGCAPCPPGHSCNGAQMPQPCTPGFEQPASAQTRCIRTKMPAAGTVD